MLLYTCDLAQPGTRFQHVWEHTVGSGHAALALRADYQAQLLRCHQELGFRHVRFHALLSDPMDTLICQDQKFLYSFFNADQIFDFLVSIGMRPFVELSFMPDTLASGNTTVFHYRANVTPPRDPNEWADLMARLARHWVDRYGAREVTQWYFEVWNEPNLKSFWPGTQAEYFDFYRRTAQAIKSVEPSLRVGGPATAQSAWIPEFLAFCEAHNVPVDFVTTHYYPTDAFGQIGADTITQLQHAPRHVMEQRAREAHRQAGDLPLYYTEWNVDSNPRGPLHDEPFAAAYATRIIMGVKDKVAGYSYWTFSDIFSENYFPSVPFQGGFGLLNIQGIPKPVYRAFQLLHAVGDEELVVQGDEHPTVSVWAIRKRSAPGQDGQALTLLMTNEAAPHHPISTQLVTIRLAGVHQAPSVAYLERIDGGHANPVAAWQATGSPEYLKPNDAARLQAASRLVKEPLAFGWDNETLTFNIDIPAQGLAAITFELPGGQQETAMAGANGS